MSSHFTLSQGDLADQALNAPDWLRENAGALTGTLLSILLIVVAAVLVRALGKRAIDRALRRATQPPEEGDDDRPRRNGRGAAVLQRGHARAAERREQRARTLGTVLNSIVTVVVTVMAVAMILDQIGIALGPLLASAGVVGLAIGFGAQSLVADYMSGLMIMMEDQYGVGDTVDLGEAIGTVEHVGLRITKVRDLHGGLWYIRNGEILRVKNDSQGWARAVLDVGVAYDADLDTVYEVLERTGAELREDPEHGKWLLEDPAVWGVQSLDADCVTVRMVVKTVPLQQWGITRQLRRRVKDALDEAGVDIPFPQRTVWMRHDGGPDAGSEGNGHVSGVGRQRS
ncbi:mechanosensitive ion channel family protein [Nocardiopsis sp. HUAS JQ3]|uniref:mechanosensitive ion channel family protein n=1 Tax=Nocardiopsis sp. HUAS JQ3 TaxID=3061629 RepID=UPI0023A9FC7A|nr:mechanosensitive ion channel family protein [Nocardiopsis sp. HUAS JQ3]WDZ90961.1 mechanosensitive ion channel family protein [Nocardiopsis sp. HUAS JQ3]